MSTPVEELCKGFPAEFATYLNYCKTLRFDEKPDYSYLRQLLRNLFHRQGFTYDYVFDWNMLKFVRIQVLLYFNWIWFVLIIVFIHFSLIIVFIHFWWKGGNRAHNAIEGTDGDRQHQQSQSNAVPQQSQQTSVNNHHQTHHSHALNLTRNNGTSGSGNGGGTPSSVAAVASGGGNANFPQTSRRLRTNSNNAAINTTVDNSLVSGID